jgi:uncharacterized membrane protein YphA (DoxX/SURF4 family)
VKEIKLQRLFSTFPGGRHGVGLLLLRLAVAITAVIQGGFYLAGAGNGPLPLSVIGGVMTLSGVALIAGFFTPLAGTLVGLVVAGTAALWIPPPSVNLFDTPLPTLLTAIMTVSVVILGPGALSVDARLFGRREIIIPRLPPTG